MKDSSELIEPLLRIREAGVLRLGVNPVQLGPLGPVVAAIASVGTSRHLSQADVVPQALRAGISDLQREDYQEALGILFGISPEHATLSSKSRRVAAGQVFNQALTTFRHPETGFERPMLLALAHSLERLAARNGPSMSLRVNEPLSELEALGVLPEDVLVVRQLLHVARTLDALRSVATEGVTSELNDLLTRYRNWRIEPYESAGSLLGSFESACHNYFGLSVFEFLHDLRPDVPGPRFGPHKVLRLLADGSTPLVEIPEGTDQTTGVRVPAFYICRYPVANLQWSEFLSAFGWTPSTTWKSLYSGVPEDVVGAEESPFAYLPAVGMSYFDAAAYVYWLRLTTPYNWRLPSESEWNFAATGGELLKFPWGTEFISGRANVLEEGIGALQFLHEDQMPQGPFGLIGLSGNAWELTGTLWDAESPEDSTIPMPDLPMATLSSKWWASDRRLRGRDLSSWETDVSVVMKGGSYGLSADYAAVPSRIYTSLFNHGQYGGLRLAVSAVWDSATERWRPESSPFVHHRIEANRADLNLSDLAAVFAEWCREMGRAEAEGGGYCGAPGGRYVPKSWRELMAERRSP